MMFAREKSGESWMPYAGHILSNVVLVVCSLLRLLVLRSILSGPDFLGGLMMFPCLRPLTTSFVSVHFIPRWCRRLDAEFSRELIIIRVVL